MYTSITVLVLYFLATACYSWAVFTAPGSPLDPLTTVAYSHLPTSESGAPQAATNYTSLTAKSTGKPRYCKKCQCTKPDRSHHCSTCGRCVLKMDHHCPWLATCVGFRNYKAFVQFLVYTSVFCWVCFLLTAEWVWRELANVDNMEHGYLTINIILLAVLSGIIGLVLGGFTGWHLYLVATGQTTIECLEKTRYLSPVKKSMEQQLQRAHQRERSGVEQSEPLLDQLKEIHANALPGITRPEEGEEGNSGYSTPNPSSTRHESPAAESLRRTYREMEEQRERDRYAAYLDEQDSQKLPHAFNLGWRRNVADLLGKNPLMWFLPMPSTTGDGWNWDVSQKWLTRRDEVARERLQRQQGAGQTWANGATNGFGMRSSASTFTGAGRHYYEPPVQRSPPGRRSGPPHPGVPVQMRRLDGREEGDEYDTSSDEDRRSLAQQHGGHRANWNDVPAELLSTNRSGSRRGGSRGRQKGD